MDPYSFSKIGSSALSRSILYLFLLMYMCMAAVKGALMEVKTPPVKCQEADLHECSQTAESLIKDPGLIFPDRPSTLDRVCNTWDKLTSCINNYTTKCYTRSEKVKFDRLFKESITAMTIVCTDQSYRNDYLKYAPCVRRVTTNAEYCGFSYQILIDQISNTEVTLKQLCCTRTKFKRCILAKTAEVCDRRNETESSRNGEKVPIGSAKPMNITTFAQQVVDKSLAFIAQQCATIKTGTDECEIGSGAILLRPNSKGPLLSEEEFQSDASSSHQRQQPVLTAATSTKFETGQKVSGTSWTTNSITPVVEKQPSQFNLPVPIIKENKQGPSQPQPAVGLGLIPKGTEPKGTKPTNDKLQQNGKGTNDESADSMGNMLLTFTNLQIFGTLGFYYLLI